MSVTYELLDVAYPFVSAVYACRCGKQEVRYASEAGAPPADWVVHESGEAAGFVCPDPADQAWCSPVMRLGSAMLAGPRPHCLPDSRGGRPCSVC